MWACGALGLADFQNTHAFLALLTIFVRLLGRLNEWAGSTKSSGLNMGNYYRIAAPQRLPP